MVKYLWIGMSADEKLKKEIVSKGGKMLSAAVSQDNFVEGLSREIKLDSINAYRLPPYPKYKERKVKEYSWENQAGKHISVGYLNLKYIGHMFKTASLKKAAKKWAKENKNEKVVVFVYSMHSPFMEAAVQVKKIVKSCRICLIVPDLPQYMDLAMSRVKAALKKADWVKIQRLMKSIDRYVLYSKHMAEFLKLKDNWTVIEGSVNDADVVYDLVEKSEKTTVMYSGVCDLRYGIPELLDAFNEIENENFELWITGVGNAVELIKERAAGDARIKYLGFLPTRKDLLLKQKSATMMINMRKPTEEASAYCFPSKLFEYMASGNPVLTFAIDGIPDEYYNYLVKMESTAICHIKDAILKVAELSGEERESLGSFSRNFVLEKKNKFVQAKKLLEFADYE